MVRNPTRGSRIESRPYRLYNNIRSSSSSCYKVVEVEDCVSRFMYMAAKAKVAVGHRPRAIKMVKEQEGRKKERGLRLLCTPAHKGIALIDQL